MVIIRKKHVETVEEKELRLKQEAESKLGIQDQYQARGFELVSWVQDHKVVVLSGIALLLLVGASYSGYLYYQKRANEVATTAFLAAVKEIDGVAKDTPENIAKWQKAQAALTDVANLHKKSGVAALAQLYAGHLALETNDAKSSMQAYENALKTIKKSDPLYALAAIGSGYAHEKNGEKQKALQSFELIIDMKEGIGKDLALWEAARLSNELKDKDRTNKYLARLIEEFPASAYEKNAKRLKEIIQ